MRSSRHFLRVVFCIAVALLACLSAASSAGDYQLGMGWDLQEDVTVGGYVSAEYESGKSTDKAILDDVAVLAYGAIGERARFLVELEAVGFYTIDFENDREDWNTKPAIERFYLDYAFSDAFNVRAGKQITPIGYWNLQPINVLRETTSNPRYSREMFPKFVSGLDFFGSLPDSPSTEYHVYAQNSRDLDPEYINIDVDSHYGISVGHTLNDDWHVGGALGRFSEPGEPDTQYLQANLRYDDGRYKLQSEVISNVRKLPGGVDEKSHAWYMQGEYHWTSQHALVARYEYFDDDRQAVEDEISVLGYSYRPVFPVSLKVEYQWHKNADENQWLTSISVLF